MGNNIKHADIRRYSYIKHKFKSRSSAEQACKDLIAKKKITSYRISWNSQNKLTVEVVDTLKNEKFK